MAKTSPKFLAKAGPAWPRPPWTASPRPRHPTGNKSCCGNFKSRINVWSCSFKPFTEHGCPVYKKPCSDLLCQNNVQKNKAALVSDKGRRAPKMEDLAAHKILKEMAAPNVHCGCWKRWIQKRSKTKVQWKLQTLAMRFSCSSSFSCSVTCLFASLNALNSIVNDFVLNFYFLLWFFSCFVWHQTTKYLYKRPLFQETEHDWFSPRRNFDIRWLRQDPNTLTSDRVSSFCTEELLVCRIFWIVFSNATNKCKNGKRYNVAPQICIL